MVLFRENASRANPKSSLNSLHPILYDTFSFLHRVHNFPHACAATCRSASCHECRFEKESVVRRKNSAPRRRQRRKISDHLYRGAQPNPDGLRSLQKFGVTTIIDLRGEQHNGSESEEKQAESLGMHFLLIPGDGWSNPTDAQIADFFNAIARQPQQTIFVHCWLGEDRTGVFVAAHRMAFDHWTPQQAIAEMHDFHFNAIWHPSMQDYIKHFPERLATSQALAPYRSLPASASSTSTPAH